MTSTQETNNSGFSLLFMVLSVIGEGISSPRTIIQTLEEKLPDNKLNPDLIKRKLSYASRHGYLKRYGDYKRPHYQLSEAGEQRLAQLHFHSLRFDSEAWDQQWRILIFDIPEEKRALRDMLRRLVKQVGMRKLQRSVWVTPLDCEEQFTRLCRAFDIQQYVMLIVSRHLPGSTLSKKHWNL